MKRAYRITLYLLLLSMLLSAFALFAPASGAAESTAAENAMNAYDKLYVGANGQKTQNGGTLQALFTAYEPNEPSLDLYEGVWYNKIGSANAILSGYDKSASNPSGWAYLEGGGFGYEDPDYTAGSDNYISIGKLMIEGDFEVEAVAAYKLRDIPTPKESIAVPEPTVNADGSRTYQIKGSTNWNANLEASILLESASGESFTAFYSYSKDAYTKPSTKSKTLTADENGYAEWTFTYNGAYIALKLPANVTVKKVVLPKYTSDSEACAKTSFVFGSLYMMTWTSLTGSNTYKNGFGLTRYYIASGAWGHTAIEYRDKNTFAALNGKIETLSVVRQNGAYTVTHKDTAAFSSDLEKVKDYPADTGFRLFHDIPSDVYAIRVYSKPLTQAEKKRNHLIDLMAYAKFPAENFTDLDYKNQILLADLASSLSLSDGAETVKNTLDDLVAALSAEEVQKSDLFYVTDGLKGLYTSFSALPASYIPGENGTKWLNALNNSESLTLFGKGWKKNKQGGFSIERTHEEWQADNDFGIRIDYTQLPENDYTVEFSVNPYGIHDYDQNGNKIRYVDTTTKYGTYKQYGYVLGPLRAMNFVSLRNEGKDGQLDKRWTYLTSGCWDTWCSLYSPTPLFNDRNWEVIRKDAVVNYAITLDETDNTSGVYSFYNSASKIGEFSIPSGEVAYIDKNAVKEQRFELLGHMPSTVYAVRIYDRVLSEAELMQNRAADLIYYHELDTVLLELLLALCDDTAEIYRSLSALDFAMSKEEAQNAMDTALSAFLLRFDGVGARKKVSDYEAIRYYFSISEELLTLLEAQGYHVELGSVASIGTTSTPTLENGALRIKAYDGEDKNGFFVNDETYALTVRYNHKNQADRAYYMTDVHVRGYMILTDADGFSQVYYVDAKNSEGKRFDGIRSVYREIVKKSPDAALYDHMQSVLNLCTLEIVYEVGEGAYSFEEALALANEDMKNATEPTRVIVRLPAGEYALSSTVTLSGKSFKHNLAELIIEGADEGSTLSSLKDIAADEFEECGENLYRYEFAADESGKHPHFRYLYVDGVLASLASQGTLRAAAGNQALIAFDYTSSGKFYLPASLVEPLRAEVEGAKNPLTALTGKDIMMHVVAQWDYNIIHLVGVDFSDYKDTDTERHYAVYTDRSEFASFCIPKGYSIKNRPVYLTGSAAFLDEEGEFHYDPQSGTLLYYSEYGIEDTRFSYPMAETLLVLENISATTIKNITFTGTDDYFLSQNGLTGTQSSGDTRFGDFPNRAALKILSSKGLTVTNCAFLSLPCEGITGRGRLEGITVSNCIFDEIGSAALRLGDCTPAWNEKYGLDNVTVCDNIFTEIAYIYRSSAALHFASARDLTVINNTIGGCSYSAISAGWRWNSVNWSEISVGEAPYVNLYNVDISSNYIYDFMTEMADGGAIYVLGGNASSAVEGYINIMQENYIVFSKNTGNGLGGMVCGIYLDACSSHWELICNIIVEQSPEADIQGTSAYLRRQGSIYVYLQHPGTGAPTCRILCTDTMILGVRAKANAFYTEDLPLQQYEVFRTYVDEKRNIFLEDTLYLKDISKLSGDGLQIIRDAGAEGAKGDEELLKDNHY